LFPKKIVTSKGQGPSLSFCKFGASAALFLYYIPPARKTTGLFLQKNCYCPCWLMALMS